MSKAKQIVLLLLAGLVLGIVVMLLADTAMTKTSTNSYCMSCHVHPEARRVRIPELEGSVLP